MESEKIQEMEKQLEEDTDKMENHIREEEKEIMDDINDTIHVLEESKKKHIF